MAYWGSLAATSGNVGVSWMKSGPDSRTGFLILNKLPIGSWAGTGPHVSELIRHTAFVEAPAGKPPSSDSKQNFTEHFF